MKDSLVHKNESTVVEYCPFCNLQISHEPNSQMCLPMDRQGDILLRPDLGMMMPGHFLAITKNHHTSFAQLERNRLSTLDKTLSAHESLLGERFGSYFRVEHGSDNIASVSSGACIDHAHIHLLPADEDVGAYIQEQLPWQEIDSYEDLVDFRGTPYIYLGRLAMHYVVPDPGLRGQWARRQVATVRDMDVWDWAVCESETKLSETFKTLGDLSFNTFRKSTFSERG